MGLALPCPMMSGAVPWQGWNTAWRSPISAEGAMPMPPIRPAVMSERMSPNMFSITMTSKSQGRFTSSSGAGIDIEPVGLDAGMALGGLIEHLAEERERLEHIGLVDAGQAATGPPARLAAFGQAERKLEQPLRGLSRDDQRLARLGVGDDALAHRGEQAFGGFPDHDRDRCRADRRRRSGSARPESAAPGARRHRGRNGSAVRPAA